jgi:hypothetical protein
MEIFRRTADLEWRREIGRAGLGSGRLPCALLGCLTLRFLGGQHGLTLGLGLTRNLRKALSLGLAGSFRSLCGNASRYLRLFLGAALGFFLFSATLLGQRLFHSQAGFFPGLGARG